MGSRAKPKSTRKPRNVRSRSEPKPSPVERRVAIGYSARKRRPADGVIFISKLGATLSSMVGSTLILCSIASALICAYSLTERGCHTLRHIGLLEWLPWKEGLRCYKTRWDWVADILGEVFVALLNGHDLGTSGLEAM
uniref:Uncharacterized protein n=1 Tax=Kwoniella pini CBS 10737 TaxID=1296096 RepID=A0A1B9I1W9_9TREE|nr:uncharacterized protein I206_04050 [Kwoniella pini CBS 10737]OCF49529.1 hypothetical protein I206_04050 [Kwoniella pini CBS 10737]